MIDVNLIKSLGGEICGDLDPEKIIDVNNMYQEIIPGSLFIAMKGQNRDGADFIDLAIEKGAVAVLTERKLNCSLPQIIVSNILLFVTRYAAKARQAFTNNVIAVVGSVGKTTLRHTLSTLLPGKKLYTRKSFNIKFSISMTLMLLDNSYDFAILEIGTNFPGEIIDLARIVQPNYTLVNSVGLEHTEFLENMASILKEEYSVLQYTKTAAISVTGNEAILEENGLSHLVSKFSNHYFLPNLEKSDKQLCFEFNDEKILFETQSQDRGLINAIAMTVFLCKLLDLNMKNVLEKTRYIHSVCHRGSIIKVGNLTIHDFSYNANPTSVSFVLSGISEECTFIFGEMKELGESADTEHRNILEKIFNNHFISQCFVVGTVKIPEEFQGKIQAFDDSKTDSLTGAVFFQGSRSVRLEIIIFKLINKRFS